jgi:hypothetical protein
VRGLRTPYRLTQPCQARPTPVGVLQISADPPGHRSHEARIYRDAFVDLGFERTAMDDQPPPLTTAQIAMQQNWAELAAWAEACVHCGVIATPRQVAGGRFVVEVVHEPRCPDALT